MYFTALLSTFLIADSLALSQAAFAAPRPTSPYTEQCLSIATYLGPRLSPEAVILLPGNSSFAALEIRSSSPRIAPDFTAIVEVVCEEDVLETIKYANACGIPFLAVSGAHGWHSTINNANGGIQISMRHMQQIQLSGSGTAVTIGGGVLQRDLVQTIYALGKYAVTGLCECTSVVGPLMGGGHSALQGMYGFVADNLISARVVLAGGKAITVSATEHPDLFWAMRGAGHNFGIVTSFEIKAYDLPKTKWTITSLVYTQDRLEAFLDALSEVDNGGDHDPHLVLAGAITHIPTIDPLYPVVAYQLIYHGTADRVSPYLARFKQARPISLTTAEHVAYKDLYTLTSNGINQTTCQIDHNISGYSISLAKYNNTAMREAFWYFSNLTADSRYIDSVWLLEAYGSRGVFSQDYDASAVPPVERDLTLLTMPITWWAGSSAEAKAKAEWYGKNIQATLAAGAGETPDTIHVYLNYAMGGERLEQVYGAERVPRLKDLKRRYDPDNRFGFYMPLM